MSPPGRFAFAVCVGLIAAALTALPAAAGGPGTPKLRGAKDREGPYKSELIVRAERPRNLFVKVKSTSAGQQDATLSEQTVGNDGDYKFRWFRGGEDISHDMQTSGHDFTLGPDAARLFRVRVKPQVADPRRVCLYTNVTVTTPPTGRNGPFFAINGRNACVP